MEALTFDESKDRYYDFTNREIKFHKYIKEMFDKLPKIAGNKKVRIMFDVGPKTGFTAKAIPVGDSQHLVSWMPRIFVSLYDPMYGFAIADIPLTIYKRMHASVILVRRDIDPCTLRKHITHNEAMNIVKWNPASIDAYDELIRYAKVKKFKLENDYAQNRFFAKCCLFYYNEACIDFMKNLDTTDYEDCFFDTTSD